LIEALVLTWQPFESKLKHRHFSAWTWFRNNTDEWRIYWLASYWRRWGSPAWCASL